jgi:hypothetical protein
VSGGIDPPYVACGVCGGREIATLTIEGDYVRCDPRSVPPEPLPRGAVRGHHRWALDPFHDEIIRVWCSRGRAGHWLEFSKFDAVAAAKHCVKVRASRSRRD